MDTATPAHTIAKIKAVNNSTKVAFSKLGYPDSSIEDVVKECTVFLAACYGVKYIENMTMTDCRLKVWAKKTGKTIKAAPKLDKLPPTTEAAFENFMRMHIQLCDWYSALNLDPPDMDPEEFGFDADHVNKVLDPRPIRSDVEVVPENILKLISCGCNAAQSFKTGRCTCTGTPISCSIFCACVGGDDCYNPHNKKPAVESDSENDEPDN